MIIGKKDFGFLKNVYLMGILNVTPDSFSDGGLYLDPEKALDRALKMQEEGADMIDVGGESSRPGAEPLTIDEEVKRISPVLKKIIPKLQIPVCIDTYKAQTARMALDEGAALINDITALGDPEMASVISRSKVPVILMHMKGEPQTMQNDVFYEDVISEIGSFLRGRIDFAVENGVERSKILIDPGLGFGKRFEDNVEIMRRLETFKTLEYPIVIGASRKSFIRNMVGEKPEDLLLGSILTALEAAQRGASLLRVHDVKETKSAIRLAKTLGFL